MLTNDEKLAERAKLLHNIGRVIGRPGYIYETLSSNYRMTEFQAALLLSRLTDVPEAVKTKHANGEYLREKVEKIDGITVAQKRDPRIYHNYYVLLMQYHPEEFQGVSRERFVEALNAEGVPAERGYGRALYEQPAFTQANLQIAYPNVRFPDYTKTHFPKAERFAAQEFQIAHQWFSTDREVLDLIVASIEKVKDNLDELKMAPVMKGAA